VKLLKPPMISSTTMIIRNHLTFVLLRENTQFTAWRAPTYHSVSGCAV